MKIERLKSLKIGQSIIVELDGLEPKKAQIGIHSLARTIREAKNNPIPSFKITANIDEDTIGQKFIKVKRLS